MMEENNMLISYLFSKGPMYTGSNVSHKWLTNIDFSGRYISQYNGSC